MLFRSNQNTSVYSLYFCSEELILSEQNKIRKTYSGTKISDIIKNTLDNNPLKVPSNKINKIEDTFEEAFDGGVVLTVTGNTLNVECQIGSGASATYSIYASFQRVS